MYVKIWNLLIFNQGDQENFQKINKRWGEVGISFEGGGGQNFKNWLASPLLMKNCRVNLLIWFYPTFDV